MAQLVLGIATSHTPMLSMTAPSWERWGRRDAQKTDLYDEAGQHLDYEELLSRNGDHFAAELTQPVMEAKVLRCAQAVDRLREAVAAARLDAMIVIGDDQGEHLFSDNLPGVLVYHGATLANTQAVVPNDAPPEIVELTNGYYEPNGDVDYPVDVTLALHVIDHLLNAGFDVATSDKLPKDRAEGHAIQFAHRRILGPDLAIVPILVNTYNPPSQPRVARCYNLGVAVGEAIRSLPGDARVGVLASGGVSHFVVLEAFDRALLAAFERHDTEHFLSIPEPVFQSGTSEIKNWIAAAGACRQLRFETVDYVPGYRSLAGTGTGMALGIWAQPKERVA